jgi:hypothetical protein
VEARVLSFVAILVGLLFAGRAEAACDQPFERAVFVPADGTTNAPTHSQVAVVVYGDFGEFGHDYSVTIDADGKSVFGTSTQTLFEDDRADPGGLIVFDPAQDFDTAALHTIRLFHLEEEVASASFEATGEIARPLGTIPLVEVVDVGPETDKNDSCGARTVRDVELEIYPAESDPLGMSFLSLHLIPADDGVNDETVYDVLPVPLTDGPIATTIEVPADTAEGSCLSARHTSGAGEVSGQATWVCLNDYLAEPDDSGCGCRHATPFGLTATLVALGLVSGRRRRPGV